MKKDEEWWKAESNVAFLQQDTPALLWLYILKDSLVS